MKSVDVKGQARCSSSAQPFSAWIWGFCASLDRRGQNDAYKALCPSHNKNPFSWLSNFWDSYQNEAFLLLDMSLIKFLRRAVIKTMMAVLMVYNTHKKEGTFMKSKILIIASTAALLASCGAQEISFESFKM